MPAITPDLDHDAARLLEGVLLASRELLQADDAAAAMARWLAHLARAAGSDRAALGVLDAGPPGQVALPTAVWSRPGIAPALEIPIPDSADFAQWAVRLSRGETVWATTDDLLDPRSRAYWAATDCACNLLVPVMVDGSCVGWVALDWAARQPWRPLLGTVLAMAAEGAAAAIRRDRERAARLAERNRLAREVHDTLAQGFGAIHLLLAAAARLDEAGAMRTLIEQADAQARQHQREARDAIRLLRGEATQPTDLPALIEHSLALRLAGTGLPWSLQLDLPDGFALPPAASAELGRIVQEAALNALRHARASRFVLRAQVQAGALVVEMDDDGCGFDPARADHGFGLRGLRERAGQIGGALVIDSRPGGPTRLGLRVPLADRPLLG